MLYIDTSSYNDPMMVIAFLQRHNVPIVSRDEANLVVGANISRELADQLRDEAGFEDEILVGEDPLAMQ